jgi:anaerobic selenocysteine-containing dehydrogenase
MHIMSKGSLKPRGFLMQSLAGLLASAMLATPALAGDTFVAGAAIVDITPPIEALTPEGTTSAILPATSIRDHLHVRAIYFANGTTCGALIGVEQGSMRGSEQTLQEIARVTGCPRTNIMASAVHSHSAGTKAAAATHHPTICPR